MAGIRQRRWCIPITVIVTVVVLALVALSIVLAIQIQSDSSGTKHIWEHISTANIVHHLSSFETIASTILLIAFPLKFI